MKIMIDINLILLITNELHKLAQAKFFFYGHACMFLSFNEIEDAFSNELNVGTFQNTQTSIKAFYF